MSGRIKDVLTFLGKSLPLAAAFGIAVKFCIVYETRDFITKQYFWRDLSIIKHDLMANQAVLQESTDLSHENHGMLEILLSDRIGGANGFKPRHGSTVGVVYDKRSLSHSSAVNKARSGAKE